MAPTVVILTFLATLASQRCVSASSWWMDAPYGESGQFNSRQLYGENLTLECVDDIIPNTTTTPTYLYWIRPDLQVMKASASESFWTLDGYAGWEVSPDGKLMILSVLQESQFGFYHCVLEIGSETYVVKKGVNYRGPYFGDLWPKYRMNVIIGCSAAGCFLVLALILMLVCNNQYKDAEEEEQEESGEDVTPEEKKIAIDGVQNRGYMGSDEFVTEGNTKLPVVEVNDDAIPGPSSAEDSSSASTRERESLNLDNLNGGRTSSQGAAKEMAQSNMDFYDEITDL